MPGTRPGRTTDGLRLEADAMDIYLVEALINLVQNTQNQQHLEATSVS